MIEMVFLYGRGNRGRTGWKTETVNNLCNCFRCIDGAENAHPPTAFTFQNVYFEHALHQFRFAMNPKCEPDALVPRPGLCGGAACNSRPYRDPISIAMSIQFIAVAK
jgi:hypothetical protein